MGNLIGKGQDEPFHAGEIFNLWSYLYETKAYLVTLQVLRNHVEDKDLSDFIDDLQENNIKQEEEQIEGILKDTGVRLPPAPPDRPNAEVQDIPAGARFQDAEIAMLIANELKQAKLTCSYIIGISAREDIRTLFSDFHGQKADLATKLLTMAKQKSWYISPPINVK